MAKIYGTDANNIKNNFINHKTNFIRGKHYYYLEGDELKAFKSQVNDIDPPLINKFTSSLYLWTERGANRHCKILDTDKAWDQFDVLEDTYFNTKEDPTSIPKSFADALRLAADQADRIEILQLETSTQKQIIGELKPKADYMDIILQNKGLVNINQIAKDYGMSGIAMNRLLHDLGVQYKQGEQWLLYAKYHDCGYTHSETISITRSDGSPDVKMRTKWTQKGRLFLYELLKSNGALPVIERQNKTA